MGRSIGPGDLMSTLSVARQLSKMQPDIVHGHGAKGGFYGRLGAALERRKGRRVAAFYAPHGGSLHYEKSSLSGRIYFSAERALETLTDGLIHVSAYEAETYRQKIGVPRCPAHVVLNGLRPEEFAPIAPTPDAADFLFIGELRELKGVDVFIEAVAKLQREGHAARAAIVGPASPQDARRYRDMANARVHGVRIAFHPPMPARQAFSLARIVVVPSRAESLPYLVLEAAAAGMPLIATNVGGIPEIFAGEAERLVRPGSVEALAAAMATAFDSPGRMVSEAVLRRARVEQKFSLAVTARQIEDIYRAALEARYTTLRASAVPEADVSR
jgi:glycosyltransferase involved in cell wall biosynthesis